MKTKRRVKSSLDVAVAEATVVKSTMSTVTSSAKSVLESMDVDPEWQREKMLNEPLELAVTKLKEAMDPFARAFVTSDIKQLRKHFTDDASLTVNLKKFKTVFEPLVKSCQHEVHEIVATHQARMSLAKPQERHAKKHRK